MTKLPLVFDNDCLSSFLWVKRTDIIKQLFPGQIIVPSIVEDELLIRRSGVRIPPGTPFESLVPQEVAGTLFL